MPSKAPKQIAVLPDLKQFTAAQLQTLMAQAHELIYPEARIRKGQIVCRKCRRWSVPKLVEVGYIGTHSLDTLSDTVITARGLDSLGDFSDEGGSVMLECQHCYQMHRIPEAVDVEWN